ncbi:unnamed protein product [Closterium sp. NIES-53]
MKASETPSHECYTLKCDHYVTTCVSRRGVSGGERKRVAIGVDMVSDPKILFLDEPTSGLDSTSAYRVVRAMKSVAIQTTSICMMVIHQPSYRVICLIDKLLLLGVGQTAYLGPPAGLPHFLASLGSPVPEGSNSTEYGLDVMAVLQAQGQRKRPNGLVIRLSFLSCASGIVFYSSCDAVPIFIEECAIFVRESANNAYRPSTYLILAGGAEGFLFMVVAFFVMFFAANAIATCVSTCVKDVVLAYALAISVMSYFYLVCGFYVTRRQMPAVLIWLHYLSPFKHAYEALAINQFARPSPCYLSVADSMPKLPNNMLSTLSIPSSLNNSLAVPPSSSNSNSSLSPTPEQLQSQLLSVLFINPIPDSALSGLSPETRAQVEAASGGCLLSGPQLLVSRSVDQLGKLECLAVLLATGLAVKLITLLLLVRLRRAKHK